MRGLRLAAGFLCAALVFMSQVSDSAAKNLAWWFDQGGVPIAGTWIRTHAAFIAHYGVASLGIIAAILLLWAILVRLWQAVLPGRPLKIVFDTRNPAQRFWKRTQAKDKNGNPLPITLWEYRVGVYNRSWKTVRNARLSIETLGQIPVDPKDMGFLKDNKETRDIAPHHIEYVPIWWVWPPQAGDAWGPTATAFHGPICVIAHGDDVHPSNAFFDYYPDRTPVLSRLSRREVRRG